jgi:hypothetical protein
MQHLIQRYRQWTFEVVASFQGREFVQVINVSYFRREARS